MHRTKTKTMKRFAIFLFLLQFANLTQAQDKLTSQLKQALDLIQKSQEHANQAADELGFYDGAADFSEIEYHLYESRIAMDSLLINLQKAVYKTTDAFYTAQDQKQTNLQHKTSLIKSQLEETITDIKRVTKEIDLVFTNTPYNLDTYLNQSFQEFNNILKQLHQIGQDSKAAFKASRKNLN